MALHPLDQFRAFQALRDAGLGEKEIAARFFVSATVVRQRLKLAAVSPKLLDLYAEDEMTLDQLIAFAVTDDHARQEQVWENRARSYNKEPYFIRRQLTEAAIHATDERARCVGLTAYEAAGGIVMRDLFEQDNGGWLQDAALLDRLAVARLTEKAEKLRAEGWKWIEVAIQFPHGHATGLCRLTGAKAEITPEEQARQRRALRGARPDHRGICRPRRLPEEVDERLDEIQAALKLFDERPPVYEPSEVARAGVFVTLNNDGTVRVQRGYVRREDEIPAEGQPVVVPVPGAPAGSWANQIIIRVGDDPGPQAETGDEEDGIKPLSERLVAELTAHRTVALRDALAGDPEIAFVAVLHVLCLRAFYGYPSDSCLEIDARSTKFSQ